MRMKQKVRITAIGLFALLVLGFAAFRPDNFGPVSAQESTPGSDGGFDQVKALSELRERIKGRESMPSEAVFGNIQKLKGVPAGRLLAIMEFGYTRSLGVSCTHCHTPADWAAEGAGKKQIAREMAALVESLNGDSLKRIAGLNPKATVNCTTCHRGEIKPALSLPSPTPSPTPVPNQTVADDLKKLDASQSGQVPPKVLEAGKKGIEELVASGIVSKARQTGDRMPGFTLRDAFGRNVSSKSLLKSGHLVVTFYRGAWCPFCNLYLRALQKRNAEFKELGANLVAISVEPPDRSIKVSGGNKLDFRVLSDPKLTVARRFGIVYEMPKVANDAVLELGFDIAKYNGMDKAELPLSATYVVDRKGRIVFAFLDPDYKRRAEPDDIIAALKKLNGK